MKQRLVIVDGMALLFRSYFATAAMGHFFPNRHGVPTNAVQGFLRHMLTIETLFAPDRLVVAWDMGAHTFRTEMYADYKAHRPEPAPELLPQFDLTREASEQRGYCNVGVASYEADDVIGTLIARFAGTYDITVISGDKDLLQLLRPHVEIAFIKKGYSEYDTYDEARFQEEYHFTPAQYADYKALIGDQADGYPGVKGVGPKTASRLIQQHGSIERLMEQIDACTPALRKKLEAERARLPIFQQLATIYCEVPFQLEESEMLVPTWTDEQTKAMESLDYSLVLRHRASLQRSSS